MPHFRVSEAAELLGVSDDTIRRWIEGGRISSVTDSNGRPHVDGKSLAEFAVDHAKTAADERGAQVSARNRLVGIVTDIRIDGLVAQVEIQCGSNRVVSLITADGARELGLEVGSRAVATVKATNVGIEIS